MRRIVDPTAAPPSSSRHHMAGRLTAASADIEADDHVTRHDTRLASANIAGVRQRNRLRLTTSGAQTMSARGAGPRAVTGDRAQHRALLQTLDGEKFETPLQAMARHADTLEARHTRVLDTF